MFTFKKTAIALASMTILAVPVAASAQEYAQGQYYAPQAPVAEVQQCVMDAPGHTTCYVTQAAQPVYAEPQYAQPVVIQPAPTYYAPQYAQPVYVQPSYYAPRYPGYYAPRGYGLRGLFHAVFGRRHGW
jgi:hypothetical protein